MARSWMVYFAHRSDDLVGIVNGIDTASFDPMNDAALVASHTVDPFPVNEKQTGAAAGTGT